MGPSLANSLFSRMWLVWGTASVATLAIVCGLCWLMLRPDAESAGVETERPVTAATVTTTEPVPDELPSPGSQSGRAVPPGSPPTATTPTTISPNQSLPPKPQSARVAPPKSPVATPPPTPEAEPKADPKPLPVPVEEKQAAKDDVKKEKKEKEDADQKPERAEIKKMPPAQVDIAARMADPIRGLQLTNVPLARALDLLATISALPITLDPDALQQLGATPRDHISVQLDSATVAQALEAVAAQRGLVVTIDNDQVVVTTPADFRETLKTVPYTVSDLTGDDKAAVAEFVTLVQMLVAPESWQTAGGRGTIKPNQGGLSVLQTGNVHRQVLVFCEKLRNARRKPLRSHDAPERFSLTTRTGQARKMLDKPVTVNFHQPTPLAKILAFLAEATGSDILTDRSALAAADTCDRVETSLTVQKKPFQAVLADLLGPLGLTYRVIGPSAIQITTKEAAEERLELEFYPIGAQGEKTPEAEVAELIEKLKTAVGRKTWTDAGGPGEVYFDAPSQCLIVLQSQPVQAAIERLLAK